jgi:predicted PurR-regulated permease PerM
VARKREALIRGSREPRDGLRICDYNSFLSASKWSRDLVRPKDSATSSKSLTLIAFVLAIAALYFGREILIPLALGLVFSFLLTPFVSQFEKLRIGRVPSVFVVLVISLGLAATISWVVASQLVEIVSEVPNYKDNLDAKIVSFHASKNGNFSKATATMQELNRELAAVPGQLSFTQTRDKTSGATRSVRPIPVEVAAPPSNFIQDLRALLGPLAGILETSAIVVIFTVFMLLKREDLRNRAIRLAGRGQLTVMTQALDDAGRRLSRYLLMQFAVNSGYGLLFGAGLYFIGVPHAFLWGVLAALLRFIPYVGVLAAASLPVIMALAVFPGWKQAGIAFGMFVALELAVSNFVEPLLYGVNTGISSLAILVAAIFWTTLWGPLGLILSTPLTVCLVVLGRYVPHLNFLEVVLGDEPVLSPEQHFYQRLLAGDEEEARAVAEAHLKEHSLENVYESIFVPALKFAAQDFYSDGIDGDTRKFMLDSTQDLIEDLGDQLPVQPASREEESAEAENEAVLADRAERSANGSIDVVCIPARNGADELIVTMLTQVLRRAGYAARAVKFVPPGNMVAELSPRQVDVVCVSALPPFGVGQARALCKKLRADFPELRVIVGLWQQDDGNSAAKDRLGTGCAAAVVTSLADAVQQVGEAASTILASDAPNEGPKTLVRAGTP